MLLLPLLSTENPQFKEDSGVWIQLVGYRSSNNTSGGGQRASCSSASDKAILTRLRRYFPSIVYPPHGTLFLKGLGIQQHSTLKSPAKKFLEAFA